MKKVLSVAAMRAADEFTIRERGVPSQTLMERAGRAIADAAENILRERGGRTVLAVCGGGNNGGDGFCAARLLEERGYECAVYCIADRLSEDCRIQREKYGGRQLSRFPSEKYDLVIDALAGTGFSGAPRGALADAIEKINGSSAFVLCADIPSGLNGDTGTCVSCVRGDYTVAVGYLKPGLLLSDGADVCGRLAVADIGIELPASCGFASFFDGSDFARLFPPRKKNSNKGDYGRATVLAGSYLYSGAALLSASAALRAGCGYVRLAVPDSLYPHYIGRLPEAILTAAPAKDGFFHFDETFLSGLCAASDAIAFGMGCGAGEETYQIAAYLLKHFSGTLVLDADALGALSKFGKEILREKAGPVILTPHLKEFSRLAGISVDAVRAGGISLAENFAKEYGVTLLLKSNASIIADGTHTAVNTAGSPALAKGGSGDALSGIVCALAARGVCAFDAAACGGYLLGRSGELAAEKYGEYGTVATDVIASLPLAIREIISHGRD